MTEALDWIRENDRLVWALVAISLASLVGAAIAIPWVIARLPADYFLHADRPAVAWKERHPALRLALLVAKNILGAVLLIAGFAMLFLPGQGLLAMLTGLLLLDYPGKWRLERALVARRWIRRPIAWVRRRSGREPLRFPEGMGE